VNNLEVVPHGQVNRTLYVFNDIGIVFSAVVEINIESDKRKENKLRNGGRRWKEMKKGRERQIDRQEKKGIYRCRWNVKYNASSTEDFTTGIIAGVPLCLGG